MGHFAGDVTGPSLALFIFWLPHLGPVSPKSLGHLRGVPTGDVASRPAGPREVPEPLGPRIKGGIENSCGS